MIDTKTIIGAAGLGAAAYLLWPKKKAAASDQPLDGPIVEPDDPDEPEDPYEPEPDEPDLPSVDPDPVSPPPPKKPKFHGLVGWDTPTSEHGIPLVGSKIVGQGSVQSDGVTYLEWRLRKTPITFTCAGELAICQYVFETRGVRRSLWDTLKTSQVTTKKRPGGFPYDVPIHVIFEEFRLEHLADYEKEKGLFG